MFYAGFMGTSFFTEGGLDASAAKVLSTVRFPKVPANVCSANEVGSLSGTASHESGWIALEQPGGWGRDIFDGVAFDTETAQALKKKLSAAGYRLLLIRKPGRLGQIINDEARRVFISRRINGADALFTFCVKGPADLLGLPLDCPAEVPCAEPMNGQVLTLMCAHAKRDQCCALRGRPIARFLAQVRPDGTVWECSHLSGHRLAPTGILLPSGYTYGRVTPEGMLAATICLEETGVPLLSGLRGCSNLAPVEQVAEIGIRELLLKNEKREEPQSEELHIHSVTSEYTNSAISISRVKHKDGRSWDVSISVEKTEEIAASCGKLPKPAKTYKIVEIIDSSHD